MKKSEKNAIYMWAAGVSDADLEKEYYDFVYRSNGASNGERMYELGYDIADCLEEDKRAKYESERNDIIGMLCEQRGIKLWEQFYNRSNTEDDIKNIEEPAKPELHCEVCSKAVTEEDSAVCCSSLGAFSCRYCRDCLNKGIEPYKYLVSTIACAGHFPEDINPTYQAIARRTISELNISEEQFIADVETELNSIY